MAGWRNAIGATTSEACGRAPTRLAYRWVKGLTGWTQSPTGPEQQNDDIPTEPDQHDDLELPGDSSQHTFMGTTRVQILNGSERITPLCDQAVVESEANAWAELWREKDNYCELDWSGIEELPPLLPEAIRAAAASFPSGTGLGVDHIPPRALLRLSDEALTALAHILMAMERNGKWDEALNLVLIVLLAKDDGGFRPIGLFPTIIRVWMRARMVQIRTWEANNFSKELYGGKGVGAQRAAWVEAFSAEAAVLEQEE